MGLYLARTERHADPGMQWGIANPVDFQGMSFARSSHCAMCFPIKADQGVSGYFRTHILSPHATNHVARKLGHSALQNANRSTCDRQIQPFFQHRQLSDLGDCPCIGCKLPTVLSGKLRPFLCAKQ